LSVGVLSNYALPLPPLSEQRAIAHILGALDDKIELNRRMNETLEATARAIFKSWFVDFGLIHAKAEGRQPATMSNEIAAIFPAKFVDTALGRIPNGWRVAAIGDVARVVGGNTPRTDEPKYWNGGAIPWATPKDLAPLRHPVLLDTERHITEQGLLQVGSGQLPSGTVLMSSRAPIGYLAISEVPVAVNQGFVAIVCDQELSNYFVLNWARTNMDNIVARANGTTFLEISKSNFRTLEVAVPSPDILKAFTVVVEPLYSRIVTNVRESATLADLREALLPKLLSGEIKVKGDTIAAELHR
jgi:type I restriction enzyme, S subunit